MATEAETNSYTCVVCGGAAAAAMSAECNWCDGRYHLNQRNDIEAKDCGAVWIDEQYLALQFACQNCLDVQAAGLGEVRPRPRRVVVERAGAARQRRYKRRA